MASSYFFPKHSIRMLVKLRLIWEFKPIVIVVELKGGSSLFYLLTNKHEKLPRPFPHIVGGPYYVPKKSSNNSIPININHI